MKSLHVSVTFCVCVCVKNCADAWMTQVCECVLHFIGGWRSHCEIMCGESLIHMLTFHGAFEDVGQHFVNWTLFARLYIVVN